ncbi:MAG: hypothetical protein V2A70_01350, partial [Candidatus Omnitrophota bacterium]
MKSLKTTLSFRIISIWIVCSLIFSSVFPTRALAQVLGLPEPGSMVSSSVTYMPVIMQGVALHPENPLLFDFIMDSGDSLLESNSDAFKGESQKLIKYFLAALTIKEDDLWVNLSPYEKDRMIEDELGKTELGQDMLAQDYILKQLTASMIYPQKDLGKAFWDRVYTKAQELYGTTDIPVDTFNKVWIVADKARVLEHNDAAYIMDAHLKVMLESDYVAIEHAVNDVRSIGSVTRPEQDRAGLETAPAHELARDIIREIIIPELEKEVNQGKNFAPLRQMFYTMILATWYKVTLKDALLNQVYSDKSKTSGVLADDPAVKDKIYDQYLQAYKVGVFNYIKNDVVGAIHESPVQVNGVPEMESFSYAADSTPRQYFSGGLQMGIGAVLKKEHALSQADQSQLSRRLKKGAKSKVTVDMRGKSQGSDSKIKLLPAIENRLKSLTRLFLTQSHYDQNPVAFLSVDEFRKLQELKEDLKSRIFDQMQTIKLDWFEVRPDKPLLRYYRFISDEAVQGLLAQDFDHLSLDIQEERNPFLEVIIKQLSDRGLDPDSLIVTKPENVKERKVKSFFAARDEHGWYHIGFLKQSVASARNSVFAFSVDGLSEVSVEALLLQLRERARLLVNDKGVLDYQDVIEMMKSELDARAEIQHYYPVLSGQEVNYPAPVRGFQVVRKSTGYDIVMLLNESNWDIHPVLIWQDMQPMDTKIIQKLLEVFSLPENIQVLNAVWQEYLKDESPEVIKEFYSKIENILYTVLNEFSRYMYESGAGSVRHYRGTSFVQFLDNIDKLPDGVIRDEDPDSRAILDSFNEELIGEDLVRSSLMLLPVQDQSVLSSMIMVKNEKNYTLGVFDKARKGVLFYPLDMADEHQAEEFLVNLNRPDVLKKINDVLLKQEENETLKQALKLIVDENDRFKMAVKSYINTKIPDDIVAQGDWVNKRVVVVPLKREIPGF